VGPNILYIQEDRETVDNSLVAHVGLVSNADIECSGLSLIRRCTKKPEIGAW
jgi:hypothetical protein